MIANLLIFLSASVALLALLDLLMSADQKKRVADIALQAWNWLDEAKRVPLLDMARTPRSQRWVIIAAVAMVCTPMIIGFIWARFADEPEEVSTDVDKVLGAPLWAYTLASWIILALVLWFGRKIIHLILRGKTALQLFARASVAFIISWIPMLVVYGTAIPFLVRYPKLDQAPQWEMITMAMGFSIITTIIFLLFWLLSAGMVLLIYLGSLTLLAAEFVMRRIAEYPKGPVVACSVVFGSAIALLKAFGIG